MVESFHELWAGPGPPRKYMGLEDIYGGSAGVGHSTENKRALKDDDKAIGWICGGKTQKYAGETTPFDGIIGGEAIVECINELNM